MSEEGRGAQGPHGDTREKGGENNDNKTGKAEIGDLGGTMEMGNESKKRLKWRTCGAGGKTENGGRKRNM